MFELMRQHYNAHASSLHTVRKPKDETISYIRCKVRGVLEHSFGKSRKGSAHSLIIMENKHFLQTALAGLNRPEWKQNAHFWNYLSN